MEYFLDAERWDILPDAVIDEKHSSGLLPGKAASFSPPGLQQMALARGRMVLDGGTRLFR
jgi:hypothetical protein